MNWSDYFYYDESSPTFLRWSVDRFGGVPNNRIRVVCAGDVAGGISTHGYGEVKLDGKCYKTHRLVWEMFVGALQGGQDIDHKDGNRVNNVLSNLRLCNDKINAQNRIKRSDNTSGVTGVNRYTNKHGREYWLARWIDTENKERAKSFRVDKLGDEGAFQAAKEHRAEMIKQLVVDGQHYTERHGT